MATGGVCRISFGSRSSASFAAYPAIFAALRATQALQIEFLGLQLHPAAPRALQAEFLGLQQHPTAPRALQSDFLGLHAPATITQPIPKTNTVQRT
ncbi:hypothetical protein D3P07_06075 [Paenibacillus sp. 1011MAR3C5]|nr:hypothetical protein D3P07_06075 [Paenibacillus sp. 1011MAR3C5]